MGEVEYRWLSVWGPKEGWCGGIFWNNEGYWVVRFVKKFGNVSSNTVELWALKEGLLIAKHLGIDNLCVDLDSTFFVYLITNPTVVNLNLEPLLSDCRNLKKSFLNCLVKHVYRETNSCIDRLAKMTAILTISFCITHCLWWLIC